MRTSERLRKLKAWTYETLCKGREMKAPAPNFDIGQIRHTEPSVYLAWAPTRLDKMGHIIQSDSTNVCPGIIIMPNQTYAKYTEEHRFDRYNNIQRSQEMGQHLAVSVLFIVYEPGERLPGFVGHMGEQGENLDLSLIREGTELGLFTLMDWMDDCKSALLGAKFIPETDLFVEEATMTYSLYTDQSYVVDRRPLYYGFVNVSFACYAEEDNNPDINDLLN